MEVEKPMKDEMVGVEWMDRVKCIGLRWVATLIHVCADEDVGKRGDSSRLVTLEAVT